MNYKIILFSVLVLLLSACGGESFKKAPLDTIIRDLENEKEFSVLLYDMDVQGNFSKTYLHKYKIITVKDSTPQEKTTDWMEVSKGTFNEHMNNMGMEIASKDSTGKLNKTPAPPGYGNYVGNPNYGQWRTGSDGSSFWEFYGKYAMMSTIFNMMTFPARRSYYDDYRGGYYGRQAYYGPTENGRTVFGTDGKYNDTQKTNKTWFDKASNRSFKDRVSQRVSRSNRSSGSSFNKTSRSSSRFSGKTFRSRGGGFGK